MSRNHDADPSQPTRSAITVAGMSGNSASSTRTRRSNGPNDVGTGFRSYFGGASDARARATVDLPIPRSRATCRCGTPSATSRRISAQSSTEITHPICRGGLVFERRYGLIFERCRHLSARTWREVFPLLRDRLPGAAPGRQGPDYPLARQIPIGPK